MQGKFGHLPSQRLPMDIARIGVLSLEWRVAGAGCTEVDGQIFVRGSCKAITTLILAFLPLNFFVMEFPLQSHRYDKLLADAVIQGTMHSDNDFGVWRSISIYVMRESLHAAHNCKKSCFCASSDITMIMCCAQIRCYPWCETLFC